MTGPLTQQGACLWGGHPSSWVAHLSESLPTACTCLQAGASALPHAGLDAGKAGHLPAHCWQRRPGGVLDPPVGGARVLLRIGSPADSMRRVCRVPVHSWTWKGGQVPLISMACKLWQHAGLVCLSRSANFQTHLPMTGQQLLKFCVSRQLFISGRLQGHTCLHAVASTSTVCSSQLPPLLQSLAFHNERRFAMHQSAMTPLLGHRSCSSSSKGLPH